MIGRRRPEEGESRLGRWWLAGLLLVWLMSGAGVADDGAGTGERGGKKAPVAKAGIDARSILDRNRAWLRPELKEIRSVGFKHVSRPKRLVESFGWTQEGASVLEIVECPEAKWDVGKRTVILADGTPYFYAPEKKYPSVTGVPPEGLERYFRDHRRGVRMNCASLDWGATPQQFTVGEVQKNHDGTLTVVLTPKRARYRINAGVMFHYTSWAYVHDLDVGRVELTIDPATHRILREVDYSPDERSHAGVKDDTSVFVGTVPRRQAVWTFSEWKQVGEDREVPLRIQVSMPEQDHFEVDYRFQWRDEGLWILKESSAAFKGKDPQRGEIVDLIVNQPVVELNKAIAGVTQALATLAEPAAAMTPITLRGLYPFEFGKKIPLQKNNTEGYPIIRDVLFAFDLFDSSVRYISTVEMTADVGLERFDSAKMAEGQLLVTFLDAQGQPIQSHYGSLAVLPLEEQSPKEMVDKLCKHNALWLAPGRENEFSYHNGKRQFKIDEKSTLNVRRAFALSTAFEELLQSPAECRAPVRFEGKLDGKPVVFAAFCGKSMDHVLGGDCAAGYGYMSFWESSGSVLFEKETWRPLVVRTGLWEIQYSDYVEIEPGVAAPLRIVLITENDQNTKFDFRFKVFDKKLWLLDRVYRNGKVVGSIKDVLWADGKAATTTAEATEKGAAELKPFDFGRVVERRAPASRQAAAIERIMAQPRPWEHPGYADLMKTFIRTGESAGKATLCMNVGRARQLKDAAFLTLAWVSPQGSVEPIAGPRDIQVSGFRLPPGETAKIQMLSNTASYAPSGVFWAEIQRAKNGCDVKVEIIDHSQDVGVAASVSLAIVDSHGVVRSTAERVVHFVNYQGTYSSEESLHLARVEAAGPLHLVSRYSTEITARRMGSSLGYSYDPYTPPLAWKQIFSGDDSRAWGYGLLLLQQNVHEELRRYAGWEFPPRELENHLRDYLLKPHKDVLARLLRTTREAKWLAVLAQLAGHTDDPKFRELLLPLLEHKEKEVREAAAIHLCRLGDARRLNLVLDVFRRELAAAESPGPYRLLSPTLVETFRAIHYVDNDEAISAVGEASLKWRKHVKGDQRLDAFFGDESQGVFLLMLNVLGHSKRPLAAHYLTRLLEGETRESIKSAILQQLRNNEQNAEVSEAIEAGLERGDATFFSCAPYSPDVGKIIARKVVEGKLKKDAFSAAVGHLTYDDTKLAKDALRQAYEKRLYADVPEAWIAVLSGLGRHGDRGHLGEAFDLLVKTIEQSPPPSADKQKEYKRKARIDGIARCLGDSRYFPTTHVADFLHGKDTDKRPAVREAVKTLLDGSYGIGGTYETLPGLSPGMVRLAGGDDGAKVTTYGGRGFGMKFTRPDQVDTVLAVEVHAGRFNEPAKEFHVYLLDGKQKVIRDFTFPMTRMRWGGMMWYRFELPPTEVPKDFWVGFNFDAQQKTEDATGVLLTADTTVSESHSYVGTPQSGYKPLDAKADFVIRVVMAPGERAR
jgi:hypothetical protein